MNNQATFTNAYASFNRSLNAHAYFKVNDRALGEDLVADTFMKTWKYLAKGGKIDMMKAFLYHILNNLIIDQYRKHKTNSLDAMVENGFDPSSEETDNIVNTLDAKALVILIKHLPLTYRKVMRMRYVQDMSLSEIALQTGQSANSIAVQSHRGLCKLRSLYMNKGAVSSMALA